MVKPGYTQVIVKNDLAERVKKKINREYQNKMSKPELSTYVQEVLWDVVESDEVMREYGAYLEKYSLDEDKVLIRDNRPNVHRIAEITFSDGMLYCTLDKSTDCLHVGFAWSIPAVYRVLKARGEKKPPISRKDL